LIIIVIVLILLAAFIYCIAPGKMTAEVREKAKIFYGLNCAHRGLHTKDQKVPENSLPAFVAAREQGYGVELDVQISKDGEVVVFHDDDLKRACGLAQEVGDINWAELSALKLFGTAERIPLLTEALEALGDAPVIVELKVNSTDLCKKTLDILRESGRYWCVESFDPRVVEWFRKNAPDVLRGQLSCPSEEFHDLSKSAAFLLANLLKNYMSRPHFVAYSTASSPLSLRLCKLMGAMNMVWTVRPEHDIKRHQKENDAVIFEYYMPPSRYTTTSS